MKRVGQLYREHLVEEIEDGLDKNKSIFVMRYSMISGFQMSELRKDLSKAGAKVFVSKNSIVQRALQNIKNDELTGIIQGQTAFVWGNSDAVEISKILIKFAKEFEGVAVQGGVLEGRFIDDSDIKKLADLPPREVLLATLLGTIKAPVTQLFNAMNAKSRDILSILKQLSEQKGGSQDG